MERLNQWIGAAIKRGSIAVLTHRNGDMDTVGSACALANIIGPSARACGIHLSTMARAMIRKTSADFLILDQQSPSWPRNLGGLIIVDAAGPSQPGIVLPDVPKCIIDHHSAGKMFELNELVMYLDINPRKILSELGYNLNNSNSFEWKSCNKKFYTNSNPKNSLFEGMETLLETSGVYV